MQQVSFFFRQVDSDEEDVEIELVEEEAPFLKGHGRHLNDLSPVRIVKNPDGSLAQVCSQCGGRDSLNLTRSIPFQAAMMQGALSKERREQKMMERQAADAATAAEQGGSQKSWNDPIAKPSTESTFGSKLHLQLMIYWYVLVIKS